MTAEQLPFPVPDQRAHLFVTHYADMHELVEDLVDSDGVPEAAATVLRTTRELLRHSYHCYEFSTAAVLHSLIAVETVLRAQTADAGKKPLHQLIEQGAASGLLTARQAEFLHDGRKLPTAWLTGRAVTWRCRRPWRPGWCVPRSPRH
ncbi:hypothetical protein [Streptomyces sp. NPDC051364]|uniref:hypothetical protein n=1 Tax=Streptomyces sp. NPDC051364 TaxID=3155799 RepID=UPI00342F2468